jgi:hypothetical protein
MGPRPLAALALAALTPALAAQGPASSCEACHADVAGMEADHPHARAGVGCTECHGGDASKPTQEAAKAEGTGFRGALKGLALVALCGECHADVETMNPYGLPTDQLAQYRTSRHGRALFEERDENVATCASCHGVHGILGPASSESRVHPTRVPATCGECHSKPELMAEYGLDPGIPEAWRASVHATKLLDGGDLSAPGCAACHGSHGAIPPGVRTVAAVCGKCHVRERELFEASPHAPLVEEDVFPGCQACHSNHEVPPAQPAILDRLCDLCHMGQEEPLGRRDRIVALLRESREQLASTREDLQAAAAQGLATEDDALLLEEAETALASARVVQHALDVARLEEVTGESEALLRQVSSHLERRRSELRLKRLSVVPVVLFLLLMSFGFWLRYRRIHRSPRGEFHGAS